MLELVLMMLLLLAYRAILAEPRTKASATEDYSGGTARGDYGGGGGGDSMNQYACPMGTHPNLVFPYCLYLGP